MAISPVLVLVVPRWRIWLASAVGHLLVALVRLGVAPVVWVKRYADGAVGWIAAGIRKV